MIEDIYKIISITYHKIERPAFVVDDFGDYVLEIDHIDRDIANPESNGNLIVFTDILEAMECCDRCYINIDGIVTQYYYIFHTSYGGYCKVWVSLHEPDCCHKTTENAK